MKTGFLLVLGLVSALLVLLASLFAGDKNSMISDHDIPAENRQLTFGKDGQSTIHYVLDQHGSIVVLDEEGEGRLITSLPQSAARQVFERSELVKRGQGSEERNDLPYFLQLRDEDGTHTVRWDDADPPASPELIALYELLLRLANRGNS